MLAVPFLGAKEMLGQGLWPSLAASARLLCAEGTVRSAGPLWVQRDSDWKAASKLCF